MFFLGQNRGKGGAILTSKELVLPLGGGSYVCANFGENRSRNATVKVLADGHTGRLIDVNRFLPHCMECRCGLAMRILSVRLSNACIVTKRKKAMFRSL